MVGGGALFMAVITADQTVGGVTRKAALLLPRGRTRGDGPNDFQVNRTAWAAGITPQATGEQWRLTLTGGPKPVAFDRAALTPMPQHTTRLPTACVEGWSTTETWTGVPLRDLARFAGVPYPASAFVRSVERCGGFNRATLQALSVGLSGVYPTVSHGV